MVEPRELTSSAKSGSYLSREEYAIECRHVIHCLCSFVFLLKDLDGSKLREMEKGEVYLRTWEHLEL